MPRVRFHAQPSEAGGSAGDFLKDVLLDPGIASLDIVVAWVRFRGVARIKPELETFRERARSRIILGLDEGGATRPGLSAALRTFSEAYVYHARAAGTFHPKVYLAEGPAKATLFVGSTNMTPGGLYFNDEASVEVKFDLPQDENEPALREVRSWVDRLLGDTGACRPLTEALIDELVSTPRYRVSGHERRRRRVARVLPAGADQDDIPEELDTEAEGGPGEALFGPSNRARGTVPPLSQSALSELEQLEVGAPQAEPAYEPPRSTEPQTSPQVELEEDSAGTLGFWKTLSAFDASMTSAPGQIIIPIRFLDFFPPLIVQIDQQATGGVKQSDVEFPLTFRDGAFTKDVAAARAILYEPAESHPRPNKELRFTFHDRDVFTRLQQNDVLVFSHDDRGQIVVDRREYGSMGAARFGPLSTP